MGASGSGWKQLKTSQEKQHDPQLFEGHPSGQHLKLRALINNNTATSCESPPGSRDTK